jgi:hypothetical protein
MRIDQPRQTPERLIEFLDIHLYFNVDRIALHLPQS